jgi:phosphate transport system substrate-binding protein
MTQKNEAPALIASLAVTAVLLVGGGWWLSRQMGLWGNQPSPPSAVFPTSSAEADSAAAIASSGQRFTEVRSIPTGLFSYGGSTTWAPIRGEVDPVIQSEVPGFQLRYVDPTTGTPGSASGIRMLLDGQLTFAQSSRPLTDEEYQRAQQRGFSLQQVPVAIEGLAIAVNPNLPVAGLTLSQLRDIYTGQITNWQQVGGPDLAIVPFSRRLEDGGTVEFFMDNVLDGAAFGNTVQQVSNTTDALRRLANTPGGIYYASAPEVVPQCTVKPLPLARQSNEFVAPYQAPLIMPEQCPTQRNQLNVEAFRSGQYPITRQLFVVIKQNGGIDQQAGEAYASLLLTTQGQTLLAQAGFVPLR